MPEAVVAAIDWTVSAALQAGVSEATIGQIGSFLAGGGAAAVAIVAPCVACGQPYERSLMSAKPEAATP